jgi:predicted ATP-dependent protease
MSGSIHNKGVLILTGFLREKFGKDKPLSLTASIAFEQNYGGIDGDSATAAEIYSLLSAIADVPIKQNFAITGSVNQKGDIQPIGGVNEKIRGFFEICKERGLDGNHSVIIPVQNIKDLMLCNNIVDAVKQKKFHIYPISRIEDGAKLLMGIEPGEMQEDGKYTKDSLFAKVTDRLEELRESKKKKAKITAPKAGTIAKNLDKLSFEEVLKLEENN